jgi:ferredoxin
MGIDVKNLKEIKGGECIACGQCVNSCPDSNKYLGFYLFGKKITTLNFVLITVFSFFSAIFIFNAIGLLRLSVPNIEKIEETQDYIKFADLKGSMSIELGAKYVGKSLADFYKLMEIPTTIPATTLLKDISTIIPGYDFHIIKSKQ